MSYQLFTNWKTILAEKIIMSNLLKCVTHLWSVRSLLPATLRAVLGCASGLYINSTCVSSQSRHVSGPALQCFFPTRVKLFPSRLIHHNLYTADLALLRPQHGEQSYATVHIHKQAQMHSWWCITDRDLSFSPSHPCEAAGGSAGRMPVPVPALVCVSWRAWLQKGLPQPAGQCAEVAEGVWGRSYSSPLPVSSIVTHATHKLINFINLQPAEFVLNNVS